jgi:hypothetical protein
MSSWKRSKQSQWQANHEAAIVESIVSQHRKQTHAAARQTAPDMIWVSKIVAVPS